MANDINIVSLVGRLTRDCELKSTNLGTYFGRFTLASNKTIKSNGESKDITGYFDCIIWGRLAENTSRYLVKGKRIGIVGSLSFSQWEKQDGTKQSKVEINVDTFQFLDSSNQAKPENAPTSEISEAMSEPFDDDIPF